VDVIARGRFTHSRDTAAGVVSRMMLINESGARGGRC
jgi:hypothetical protein